MTTHVGPNFPFCAPRASGVLWAKHNLDLPPGFETSDLPKYGSIMDGMVPLRSIHGRDCDLFSLVGSEYATSGV
eukprot:11163057-Alexandrium_andersonii.AAC.1